MQILDLLGEKPSARFGHTVTPITKTKVLLFGGATGDSGKYTITNDTFLLDCHSNLVCRCRSQKHMSNARQKSEKCEDLKTSATADMLNEKATND